MKLAVVTGSSGGIGQSVCKVLAVRAQRVPTRRACEQQLRALALPAADCCAAALPQAEGYTVVGIDQHDCPALETVAGVHLVRCCLRDLCVEEDLDAEEAKRGTSAARTLKALLASLQPATTSAGPKLALLVNNAATQIVAPFGEITLKDFNDVISTNLTVPFMLTKLLLPELKVRASLGGARAFAMHLLTTRARRLC